MKQLLIKYSYLTVKEKKKLLDIAKMRNLSPDNNINVNGLLIACISDSKLLNVMSDLLKHIESSEFNSFLLKIRKNSEILKIVLIDYNSRIDEFVLVNNKLLNNKL